MEHSLHETKRKVSEKCGRIEKILSNIENDLEQKNYEFKNQNLLVLENLKIQSENRFFGNLTQTLNVFRDNYHSQYSNAQLLQSEKKSLALLMKKLGKHFVLIKSALGIEVISQIKSLIRQKNFRDIPNKIL